MRVAELDGRLLLPSVGLEVSAVLEALVDLEVFSIVFFVLFKTLRLLYRYDVRYRDILVPLPLIFAGGKSEGRRNKLVGVERGLGEIAEGSGGKAVGDALRLIVVGAVAAKLLQTNLALLALIAGRCGVGLGFCLRHYTEDACVHKQMIDD